MIILRVLLQLIKVYSLLNHIKHSKCYFKERLSDNCDCNEYNHPCYPLNWMYNTLVENLAAYE